MLKKNLELFRKKVSINCFFVILFDIGGVRSSNILDGMSSKRVMKQLNNEKAK